jgi:hypothetical protein
LQIRFHAKHELLNLPAIADLAANDATTVAPPPSEANCPGVRLMLSLAMI